MQDCPPPKNVSLYAPSATEALLKKMVVSAKKRIVAVYVFIGILERLDDLFC